MAALPVASEQLSVRWQRLLRYGTGAITLLTLALNTYALAAVVSRTLQGGLTANRHAVIGWNVVTLLMLIAILVGQIRASPEEWVTRLNHRRACCRWLCSGGCWFSWPRPGSGSRQNEREV